MRPSDRFKRCSTGVPADHSGGVVRRRTRPTFSKRAASLQLSVRDNNSTRSPASSNHTFAPHVPLPIGMEPAASLEGVVHTGSYDSRRSSGWNAGGVSSAEVTCNKTAAYREVYMPRLWRLAPARASAVDRFG